jgi:hypothetical protein
MTSPQIRGLDPFATVIPNSTLKPCRHKSDTQGGESAREETHTGRFATVVARISTDERGLGMSHPPAGPDAITPRAALSAKPPEARADPRAGSQSKAARRALCNPVRGAKGVEGSASEGPKAFGQGPVPHEQPNQRHSGSRPLGGRRRLLPVQRDSRVRGRGVQGQILRTPRGRPLLPPQAAPGDLEELHLHRGGPGRLNTASTDPKHI